MKKAYQLIKDKILDKGLISITFSSPREKKNEIKSIIVTSKADSSLKKEIRYIKHNDIKDVLAEDFLNETLNSYLLDFKQILLKTNDKSYQILLNKKLSSKILEQEADKIVSNKSHNRDKNYLIPDGSPCLFLIEIGVMEKSGKVKPKHYKKFKQINRFLEMVDDLYKGEKLEKINAIDFGSGKSYLTFAIYHYFKEIKEIDTKITGIDLKQEVIDNCNLIAKKLDYTGLNFVHGFIHNFKTDEEIDFVMTLHACDTATDEAILFSLKHKAKNMIFVPCCQHELNKQLKNKKSHLLIEHGVHRDKLCALVTDSSRAKFLEAKGYKVQVMEFIETEHTPKNIMIRCQKIQRKESLNEQYMKDYLSFIDEWSVVPYLAKSEVNS